MSGSKYEIIKRKDQMIQKELWSNLVDVDDILPTFYQEIGKLSVIKEFFAEKSLVAELTPEIKSKIESGEWILKKSSNGRISAILRDGKSQMAKHIDLVRKTPEMAQNIHNAVTQAQLAQIAEQLKTIQKTVDSIVKGQYDDRFAMYYSAERQLENALLMKNEQRREIALLNALNTLENARSTLMQSFLTEIGEVEQCKKPNETNKRLKFMEKTYPLILKASHYAAGIYNYFGESQSSINALNQAVSFLDELFGKEIGKTGLNVYQYLDSNTKRGSRYWENKAQPMFAKLYDLSERVSESIYLTNGFILKESSDLNGENMCDS